jgi:hypothetical protein
MTAQAGLELCVEHLLIARKLTDFEKGVALDDP